MEKHIELNIYNSIMNPVQEDPEPIEPETVETEEDEAQDSIQKPAKKKGRPPLSDKQKAALKAGREKSRKNMQLAMTKAKLERLQSEPTTDDPHDQVTDVKPKKKAKPKQKRVVVVESSSDDDSSDTEEEIIYVKPKKKIKKKPKKKTKKRVVVESSSDESESDSDEDEQQQQREAEQIHHVYQPKMIFR